jgi:hypothetical protein
MQRITYINASWIVPDYPSSQVAGSEPGWWFGIGMEILLSTNSSRTRSCNGFNTTYSRMVTIDILCNISKGIWRSRLFNI